MNFEELPEDMQEEVRALKHGSVTIQADVWDAIESTDNIEEFWLQVSNCMDELISEAQGVRMTLGTVRENAAVIIAEAASAFRNGRPIAYPLCTLDKEDIEESAANLGLDIKECDFEEIIKRLCLRISDTFGDVWGDVIDEEVEFVVNNRIAKEMMK